MAATLCIKGEKVVLKIRDDGHGILPSDSADGTVNYGVGLAGMEARLRQLNGSLRIVSSDEGTTLIAEVPLTPPPPAIERSA